ncbi:MAG: hypothetical protein WAZ30_07685, partial [Syntrophorhabdus sp.]
KSTFSILIDGTLILYGPGLQFFFHLFATRSHSISGSQIVGPMLHCQVSIQAHEQQLVVVQYFGQFLS